MNENEFDYRIKQLDRMVMSLDIRNLPLGLFDGKMGLCIYFFHLAKLRNDHEYLSFAEKLLKHIYSLAGELSTIHLHAGMSGVAWGIHYLVKNEFVTGNLDQVLQEADDLLFRTIQFDWLNKQEENRLNYLKLLVYYSSRLQTTINKTEKVLSQKMAIRILNNIENSFSDTPWEHPAIFNLTEYELALYLILLSRFYKLDFYNYKIVKIWDGLSNTVLSSIPVQHNNRLLLLLGIQSVLKCISLPQWEAHAILLESNIDHEKIINQEFLNKNITLRRGISGYCLLLSLLQGGILSSDLKVRILKKIESSDIWEERFNVLSDAIAGNIGLANGYTGVALVYYSLLKS